MSRRGDNRAIGLRELNLDLDFDDFVMRFVVQSRALRAVVRLPAGILDEKRERRQETDGRNVRPGFGRSCWDWTRQYSAKLPQFVS